MYIPAHFAEHDVARARALIHENPFGLIVVPSATGRVEMAHIPFLVDAEPEPLGTLRAHVARPNPIAGMLATPLPVICVFRGPHTYVSPRWYEAPSRSVPTWNFAAVHAHGVATRVDDRNEVLRALADLTARHEEGAAQPWSPAQAEPAYIEGLLRGIVAFTIKVGRFETKMKLSQNRSPAERRRVVAALRARRGPSDQEVAAMIEERGRSE